MKYKVNGFYGSGRTPATVLVVERAGLHWYAVSGSQTVNASPEPLADGVWVEEIADIDCFTFSRPIRSLDELSAAVDA